MNVYDHAHALAKSIRKSSQYTEFKNASKKLQEDETARKMLNDFRQTQMEHQKRKMENDTVSQEEEEKMQKLSELVNLNLTVKNYLEKEYQLAVMIRDVQKIIGEAIEEIMEEERKEDHETENGNH